MSKLSLYSIFHGNLNYSSIPPQLYEEIIDSCYWPILDILKNYKFKTGIEFPLNTLIQLQKIDPLFLEELKKNIVNEKCEIVCSGKEQVIFPFVPQEINELNLNHGKQQMEDFFSQKINTGFVNEQIFSSGLIELYLNSGLKNIFSMWEWNTKFFNFDPTEKFLPKKITSKNQELNVIWNSYISYQKFQRYINNTLEKSDYLNYITKHFRNSDTCLPFYGSDMEIFGYKNPVLGIEGTGKEIERFHDILAELEKNSDIEFLLPHQIIQKFPPKKSFSLNSAEFAITGKKQAKFSISRWATCGRDNGKSNSICFKILKKIRILKSLSKNQEEFTPYMLKLIDCWASDYRTHTTETKYSKFLDDSNQLNSKISEEINQKSQKIFSKTSDEELILYNPNDSDWQKLPFEIKLYFKHKSSIKNFEIFQNGDKIISQLEDVKFYKNGFIRSVTLVIEPFIKKLSTISLTIKKTNEPINIKKELSTKLITSQIEVAVLKKRGASIANLKFTKIDKNPMIGHLEHGTFEDTKLSSDFYSGHMVAFDRHGNKITDLSNVEPITEIGNFPIRKKISSEINMPFGSLTKIIYAYENHPRLDLKYIFNFNSFQPSSFRLGYFTLKPETFEKNSLKYSVHNGGKLESYTLEDDFNQEETTDPRLSSSGCLGSTECFIDFGDNKKGFSVFSDKSNATYSVPLLTFTKIGDSFFCRTSNTISEFDDTTMTWWKGRKEITFSVLGRKNEIEANEIKSKNMFLGLVCLCDTQNLLRC